MTAPVSPVGWEQKQHTLSGRKTQLLMSPAPFRHGPSPHGHQTSHGLLATLSPPWSGSGYLAVPRTDQTRSRLRAFAITARLSGVRSSPRYPESSARPARGPCADDSSPMVLADWSLVRSCLHHQTLSVPVPCCAVLHSSVPHLTGLNLLIDLLTACILLPKHKFCLSSLPNA